MPLSRDRTMGADGGFTLIELLIVVVILGILAAIAIPQFSSTKQKAYDAAAKSDLRNLMSAQEAYLANQSEYAPDLTSLETETRFNPSANVNLSISRTSPGDYNADASHGQSPDCYRVVMDGVSDQQLELVKGAGSGGGNCGG